MSLSFVVNKLTIKWLKWVFLMLKLANNIKN